MKFIKYLLVTIAVLTLLGVGSVVALYYYVKPELPSVATLKDVRLQVPMQVYTADGKLISQFGEQRRTPKTLDEIPQQLIDAIIATEDSRFYDHFGIDPIGVVRAAMVLVTTGEIREGASTITMQLARNFFLTRERAWMRKIKEAFIALHIEEQLSKDEILELYLNKLALGQRAYGVGAAAEVYYGRELHELTLAEIATIAGLPKGPSILNPISNPPASVERRRIVLRRMLDEGFISHEEYEVAFNAPVTARLHGATIEVSAPYLAEMVRNEMVERYGAEEAYTGGYRVYTTVSSKHQLAAERALRDNLHAYDERHGYRGPTNRLWGELPQEALQRDDADPTLSAFNPETLALTESRGDEPWPTAEIIEYLQRQPVYGPLRPAVVTQVGERDAQIIVRDGSSVTLGWDSMDWARPYVHESAQGPAPETASDILTAGDHIWVRREDNDADYKLAQIPGPSSAIVAIEPQNGALAAVVGGYSFQMSQYNRALQAKRQVGSSIKPFIYAAALEDGYTLSTMMNDAPITQWNPGSGSAWRPRNSPEVYDGPIRLRKALARSKNVVSVRLIRSVGVDSTAEFMQRFGFAEADIPRNESLSLGSASFTPLEVVRGFSVFANGGFLVDPYFIARVETIEGDIVEVASPTYACADCQVQEWHENSGEEHEVTQAPRVLSEQTAFLINDGLTSSVWGGGSWPNQTGWNGTAWRAQSLGNRNIAGKTGTTNDVKDAWFVGYGTDLVATVWVGFDNVENSLGRVTLNANLGRDRQPIVGSEAGATTSLPGWIAFMETVAEDFPMQPFELPPDIVSVRIDDETGKLSNRSGYTSLFEYFLRGTEPTEFAETDDNSPRLFEDAEDELFR